MKYLWTEDSGAGLHFWKLVNQILILVFDNLVKWTDNGKKDKINIREEFLAVIKNHNIDVKRLVY